MPRLRAGRAGRNQQRKAGAKKPMAPEVRFCPSRMTVILTEFDAARKVEAGHEYRSPWVRLLAGPRQNPRATTRYTARGAPDSRPAAGQGIDRALVVTLGGENPLFTSNSRVTLVRRASLTRLLQPSDSKTRRMRCHRRATGRRTTRTPRLLFLPTGRGPPAHSMSAFFQSRSMSSEPRRRARRYPSPATKQPTGDAALAEGSDVGVGWVDRAIGVYAVASAAVIAAANAFRGMPVR